MKSVWIQLINGETSTFSIVFNDQLYIPAVYNCQSATIHSIPEGNIMTSRKVHERNIPDQAFTTDSQTINLSIPPTQLDVVFLADMCLYLKNTRLNTTIDKILDTQNFIILQQFSDVYHFLKDVAFVNSDQMKMFLIWLSVIQILSKKFQVELSIYEVPTLKILNLAQYDFSLEIDQLKVAVTNFGQNIQECLQFNSSLALDLVPDLHDKLQEIYIGLRKTICFRNYGTGVGLVKAFDQPGEYILYPLKQQDLSFLDENHFSSPNLQLSQLKQSQASPNIILNHKNAYPSNVDQQKSINQQTVYQSQIIQQKIDDFKPSIMKQSQNLENSKLAKQYPPSPESLLSLSQPLSPDGKKPLVETSLYKETTRKSPIKVINQLDRVEKQLNELDEQLLQLDQLVMSKGKPLYKSMNQSAGPMQLLNSKGTVLKSQLEQLQKPKPQNIEDKKVVVQDQIAVINRSPQKVNEQASQRQHQLVQKNSKPLIQKPPILSKSQVQRAPLNLDGQDLAISTLTEDLDSGNETIDGPVLEQIMSLELSSSFNTCKTPRDNQINQDSQDTAKIQQDKQQHDNNEAGKQLNSRVQFQDMDDLVDEFYDPPRVKQSEELSVLDSVVEQILCESRAKPHFEAVPLNQLLKSKSVLSKSMAKSSCDPIKSNDPKLLKSLNQSRTKNEQKSMHEMNMSMNSSVNQLLQSNIPVYKSMNQLNKSNMNSLNQNDEKSVNNSMNMSMNQSVNQLLNQTAQNDIKQQTVIHQVNNKMRNQENTSMNKSVNKSNAQMNTSINLDNQLQNQSANKQPNSLINQVQTVQNASQPNIRTNQVQIQQTNTRNQQPNIQLNQSINTNKNGQKSNIQANQVEIQVEESFLTENLMDSFLEDKNTSQRTEDLNMSRHLYEQTRNIPKVKVEQLYLWTQKK
ncbi:Protein_LicA [Hexamita inflata]|uniref:Protein LicA n=1 Tax=Hexamita inflata TaxID=28002 RepID=A0AA86U8I6_9EUKA|nr:Protein LicA [Hexamita inflata]